MTLFEALNYVGGHVNTVSVEIGQERHEIDTGFIVFNSRTYPHFSRLLEDLRVVSRATEMSFSVRCDRTGLEYNGTSLNGVFAQRRNLLRPSFLRMLRDILRFNREGPRDMNSVAEDATVGEYLSAKGFSQQFADQYLLPMGAAIWSCPVDQFERFPIRFILEFYQNHGLLSLRDRPQWKVIAGGSQRYIQRMVEPFKDCIRLHCPVWSAERRPDSVVIRHRHGVEEFDEVIFACHSDQALKLLADPDPLEIELLSSFPYSCSTAVLHTDTRVLPKRRRAWASWNYHVAADDQSRPTLTYNMNILQHIQSQHTFCVTLNDERRIDADRVIATFEYSHPVFTANRARMQRRHSEVIRRRRTSFCGAYWRNGFHEDGLVSALAVCEAFENTRQRLVGQRREVLPC